MKVCVCVRVCDVHTGICVYIACWLYTYKGKQLSIHVSIRYNNKRHTGEWVEETKASKFWSFLLKDLHGSSWKYFVWLLLKKLLLAALMSLTVETSNAVLAIVLQVVDVLALMFTWPNEDNLVNFQEGFGAISTLVTIVCAALPSIGLTMPDWLGDFVLLCCALAGTAIASVTSLVGPISALLGKIQSLCGALFQNCPGVGGNLQEGAIAGVGGAATAAIFDSVVEIIEDGVDDHFGGDEEQENDGSSDDVDGISGRAAMAVGVGAGVAAAGGRHSETRQGLAERFKGRALDDVSKKGVGNAKSNSQKKEEKQGTSPLRKKKKAARTVDPEFPPEHITLKLLLDFRQVAFECCLLGLWFFRSLYVFVFVSVSVCNCMCTSVCVRVCVCVCVRTCMYTYICARALLFFGPGL